MKKALVILMALSMVFAAFADEPALKNEVATFSGDASVTWGLDLDTFESGFQNATSGSFKFSLLSKGDKATAGDGIWGELKIKFDGVDYEPGSTDNLNGKAVSVDTAKIHINDMISISILSGSNAYGEFKPTLAVFSDNGHLKTASVGGKATQGIGVDVTLDGLLDLTVDVRSAAKDVYGYTATHTENAYAAKPTWNISESIVKTDTVNYSDRTYTVGNTSGSITRTYIDTYGQAGGYTTTHSLTDAYYTAYLTPSGSITSGVNKTNLVAKPAGEDDEPTTGVDYNGDPWAAGTPYETYLYQLSLYNDEEDAVAADLAKQEASKTTTYWGNQYGIGAKVAVKAVPNLDLNAGFGIDLYGDDPDWGLSASAAYKLALSDDGAMYVKPQVGFTMGDAMNIAAAVLVGWGAENQDTNIKWVSKKVSDGVSVATTISTEEGAALPLCVGVWDSTFVPNLKAGAQLHINDLGDFAINTLAVEASYALDGGITPSVAFAINDKGDLDAEKTWTKLYAGCSFSGFVANTTFTAEYESGDLAGDTIGLGTVKLTAKIAF